MAKKKRKNRQAGIPAFLVFLALLGYGLYQNANSNQTTNTSAINSASTAQTEYGGLSKTDYQKLANLNFQSGQKAIYVVNQNHSTLIKNAWKVNKVIYSNLDNLNRTSSSNTAFIERRNVANQSLRVRQFVNPTGWHSNRANGEQIYNRGHLIAYSVSAGIDQSGNFEPNNQSGDQNNPKNLFTQSAFSNQKLQTIYESKVRLALKQNKKVIYQATPIFRGSELMARGINLQAISTDGSLDFNVYIFNVQPGFSFDYATGRAKVNRGMQVNE
ncbi:DNA/RNA non-specific endonuclease [Lactobacillus psittaci]|uniref:DNA-entry nuclease n=1 Tax=Lactobacillus psittaci DSM 15354 TaxID=1122152 RepID=A0A0R1S301_9LACO|nr:DNA/RNA non-specific endonuclease [Lactobacillus psittaci]KRL63388.1 DNA-entry nuclease [Lactobacillus psittaci DSM 15354]